MLNQNMEPKLLFLTLSLTAPWTKYTKQRNEMKTEQMGCLRWFWRDKNQGPGCPSYVAGGRYTTVRVQPPAVGEVDMAAGHHSATYLVSVLIPPIQ